MQQMTVEPRLLRLEQASAALGVSHWTLRLWAKQGKLRTVKLGSLRLVPAKELDRVVQQGIGRPSRRRTTHKELKHGPTA